MKNLFQRIAVATALILQKEIFKGKA